MRIGLNLPDPQRVSAEKSGSVSVPQGAPISDSGSDGFSGDTVSLSALANQALQSPEIRQDKVNSLQNQIDSGAYQVNLKSIADAMLGH